MIGLFIWMYVTAVSVSGLPASIDQNQEFEIDTNLTCTNCSSDSYLRAVFYPGGTSYFGFTQNNSGQWINAPGGSCLAYYKVPSEDLSEGSWSGKLKVKPDTESALFQGPGEYLFKIGRYTGSCSSPTWSTETTISITGPTHTPTPGPTQTPAPTATVRPTPTATPAPAPTKIISSTPTIMPTDTPISSPSATPVVLGSTIQKNPPNAIIISLTLVGLGLGVLSLALVWQKRNAIINK